MGFDVHWVAGGFEPGWHANGATTVVPGLGIDDDGPPDPSELATALAGADLVVVENLCTIPLNPVAAHAVAEVLRGRPAVLHHHDPPWQRARFAHVTALPPAAPLAHGPAPAAPRRADCQCISGVRVVHLVRWPSLFEGELVETTGDR